MDLQKFRLPPQECNHHFQTPPLLPSCDKGSGESDTNQIAERCTRKPLVAQDCQVLQCCVHTISRFGCAKVKDKLKAVVPFASGKDSRAKY